MPWITKNGRGQFVGDWAGLSDGERYADIHNHNAAWEDETRRIEEQKKKRQTEESEKEE